MSQENVELCNTMYDRWNREEYEAFFALVSADVEWVEGYNPEVGVYHGREGGRKWFATTSGAFEHPGLSPCDSSTGTAPWSLR